ncbi:hypothetical protein ACIBHX_41175 [Nonomuraea sp. NPDC050536]|uniref:hypothetical protein n=1 Tax=Nonomuraea sp. NPDC050536 TaxID=3364366 RepID=UPI0037C80923
MNGNGDESGIVSSLANLNGVTLSGIDDADVATLLDRFRLAHDEGQVAAFNSSI